MIETPIPSIKKSDLIGPRDLLPTLAMNQDTISRWPKAESASFFGSSSELPFGVGGQSADYILVGKITDAIGLGPITQVLQISEGARKIGKALNAPVGYIGPDEQLPEWVTPESGALPNQIASVNLDSKKKPSENFRTATAGFIEAFKQIAAAGKNNIVIIINGYSAFAPFAIKKALSEIGDLGKSLNINVMMEDSCYPDKLNYAPVFTDDGYPLLANCGEAFYSTDRVVVYLVTANLANTNPKWSRARAPKGTWCGSSSLPVTSETIESWKKFQQVSMSDAKNYLINRDPNSEFAQTIKKGDPLIIPFLANSDYFDSKRAFQWLTKTQYKDMEIGAELLCGAANVCADIWTKGVILTGPDTFIELIKQLHPRVTKHHNLSLIPTPRLKQNEMGYLYRSAPVLIIRSYQQNAAGELVYVAKPSIEITMPAHGFMDADKVGTTISAGRGKRYSLGQIDPDRLARKILHFALNPNHATAITANVTRLHEQARKSTGINFWGVVAQISGLKVEKDY